MKCCLQNKVYNQPKVPNYENTKSLPDPKKQDFIMHRISQNNLPSTIAYASRQTTIPVTSEIDNKSIENVLL